jgi:SWI/SNF-related matrix-associated actin-dependent regulator of chromatin subfamily A3
VLRREQGWDLDENSRDMWAKAVDSRGQIKFINNVNGLSQDQAPPNFAGGLLADDMGLGKTLSMICLIAANQACSGLPSPPLTPGELATALPVVKTTLLIVPPSLIQSWDKQLQTHLRPNTLKWYVFHGQSKKEAVSLGKYDVVITTYYTISSIWRKQNRENRNSSPLFSTEWHRIVLDEGKVRGFMKYLELIPFSSHNSKLAESPCSSLLFPSFVEKMGHNGDAYPKQAHRLC